MKPWFEKELAEADIIKFPVPQAKVIQMPNVQEYPDFITGVQDLQAKQKDGAISQESYDKLYAELIHRFMKKESFDKPWYLREQPIGADQLPSPTSNIDIGDAVQDLIDVANDSNDPAFEKKTENLLTKARDFLKNLLNKPKTEDVQPAINQMPQGIENLFLQLCAKHPPEFCAEVKTQIIDATVKLKQQEFEKGKVAQKTQTANIKNDIQELISIMISKFSPTEAKSQKRLEQIRSFFTTKNVSDDDTIEFLKLANQGQVINMQALIAAGQGKITDHVNPAAIEVYNTVARSFMELQPEKTTGRGNIGSGEVFFITLGRPATKSAKGDLTVPVDGKDRKIEVKASRYTYKKNGTKGMSGGRFSGDAMASPPDIQKPFSALLKKYFNVTGFDKNKKFVYNITKTTLRKLNQIITDKKISRKNVVAFTDKMLTLFHTNLSGKTEKIAEKMVNPDGTIDANAGIIKNKQGEKIKDNKFYRGITYANYMSYQRSNRFDAILSFNMDGQTYEFIKGGNDLAKKISSGQIRPFGGIDFNDSQNKAALQVFTKPE